MIPTTRQIKITCRTHGKVEVPADAVMLWPLPGPDGVVQALAVCESGPRPHAVHRTLDARAAATVRAGGVVTVETAMAQQLLRLLAAESSTEDLAEQALVEVERRDLLKGAAEAVFAAGLVEAASGADVERIADQREAFMARIEGVR